MKIITIIPRQDFKALLSFVVSVVKKGGEDGVQHEAIVERLTRMGVHEDKIDQILNGLTRFHHLEKRDNTYHFLKDLPQGD